MTMNKANVSSRDVQGTRGNYAPVIDGRRGDRLGSFIPREMASRFVESANKVQLQKRDGTTVVLATADDWANFVSTYLKAPSSRLSDLKFMAEDPKGLQAQFDLTYENLCKSLDDAGSQIKFGDNPNGITNATIEILPGGEWDKVAHIYGNAVYGMDLDETKSVPLNAAGTVKVDLVPAPKIGPSILNATASLTRDRLERESRIAVIVESKEDAKKFREVSSSNAYFQPLDVTKLGPYQERAGVEHIWQDDKAVACFERFPYPMHLEVNGQDETGYQANKSPFIEGMVDTPDLKLARNDLEIRYRWRPEQAARTNLQGKQAQGRDPQTGLTEQKKFEHRDPRGTTGTGPDGEALHLDLLEQVAITGMMGPAGQQEMSAVHREVYQALLDLGAIQPGESITLDSKVVDYQDRRRMHLIFYSQREMETLQTTLQQNLDQFDQLTQGASADDKTRWRSNLERMSKQVGVYVDKIKKRDELVRKYGGSVNTSFDGLIISRDEKVGFEAGAFGKGSGIWPGDRKGTPATYVASAGGDFVAKPVEGADRIDDLGTIYVAESELDSNVSDPVKRAYDACQATATGQPVEGENPRPGITQDEAKADLDAMKQIYEEVGLAADSAMKLQGEAYEAVGLKIDPNAPDQTYSHFAKALEAQGNRSWFNVVSIRNANVPRT